MWNTDVRSVFLAVSSLCLAACQAAQTSDDAPRPEGAALWVLGSWSGTRTAADDGDVTPLTVRVSSVLGGAGLIRELEVDLGGSFYRGLSLDVREVASGEWVRTYVNGTHGRFVPLRTTGEIDADRVVWRSDNGGKSTASEVVSERLGRDHWRTTVRRTTDGGSTWTPVFTDDMRRDGSL